MLVSGWYSGHIIDQGFVRIHTVHLNQYLEIDMSMKVIFQCSRLGNENTCIWKNKKIDSLAFFYGADGGPCIKVFSLKTWNCTK